MVSIIVETDEIELWAEGEAAARDALLTHIRECHGIRPHRAIVKRADDGWDVKLVGSSTKIVRLRRITGYLSSLDSFNSGKRAEERDRKGHPLQKNLP